jgi:hypothetical protein
LVEHTAENRGVAGSIPALATFAEGLGPRPGCRQAFQQPFDELSFQGHLVRPRLTNRAVQGGRLVTGECDQAEVRVVAAETRGSGDSVEQGHVQVDHDVVRIEIVGELADCLEPVRRGSEGYSWESYPSAMRTRIGLPLTSSDVSVIWGAER